jgi:hypothetical protein
MVTLSASEMNIVLDGAASLDRERKDTFVAAVLSSLEGCPELGPGVIHRTVRALQRQYFDPPLGPRGPGTGHFDSRSSKLRDGAAIA